MQDEFISGTSAAYLESLEDQWREDPNSVPASWASLLRQMGEWTRLVYRPTGDSRARTRAVRAARLIPPHAGAHRGARYFPNNARRFAPR
jgi:2-oxoglutarate dehydrogenase complex dehydrogenase (E1) component-like enzyme